MGNLPPLDRAVDIIAGPPDLNQEIREPASVATDSDGCVIVADPKANAVHVFDFPERKYFRIPAGSGQRLRFPSAVAVDQKKRIYVADSEQGVILVYDPRGKFLRYFGRVKGEGGYGYYSGPRAIAIDPIAQHLYVADSPRHMIFMLNMRGQVLKQFGKRGGGSAPGIFRFPSGIAVKGNELIVADMGNSRIQVLDKENGTFHRQFQIPDTATIPGALVRISLDREGRIYVASPIPANTVQIYDESGKRLDHFDGTGKDRGNFASPLDVWIDQADHLYVADSKNHRIQVFQIEPMQ